MQSRSIIVSAAVAGLLVGLATVHADDATIATNAVWTEDFAAAKAQAAKDGKDIFAWFTGSDWCHWCKLIEKEITSTTEFTAEAPKHFVLFKADFPRDKSKVAPATMEQNTKLRDRFGVRGYPTILLLDVQERPYAKLGYQQGGPEPFLTKLNECRAIREKRDAAWKKAESATGVEKGKLLAEGLMALDDELAQANYTSVVDEIRTLDPQDSTGLLARFAFKEKLDALAESVGKTRDETEADKLVDDFVAESKATGERKQQALMLKLSHCSTRTLEGADKAMALMNEVIAIDATTDTAKTAERIKPRIETVRERIKAQADGAK